MSRKDIFQFVFKGVRELSTIFQTLNPVLSLLHLTQESYSVPLRDDPQSVWTDLEGTSEMVKTIESVLWLVGGLGVKEVDSIRLLLWRD